MFEIGDDERKVLLCLIHAETPITVMEDTGIQINVTVDIIRQLHHYRYIKAIGKDDKVLSPLILIKFAKPDFNLPPRVLMKLVVK